MAGLISAGDFGKIANVFFIILSKWLLLPLFACFCVDTKQALRNTGSSPYEICYLANWQEKYNGKYLDEIIYLQETEKIARQEYSSKKLNAKINLSSRVEKIVDEATEQAKQTPLPKSKRQRVKNIRKNRGLEKEKLRHGEAFLLPDKNIAVSEQPTNEQSKNGESLLYLDLIRKNAEKRKND